MAIVTLTTDFGRRDHYVACMKGVMMQIAPAAVLVDVTHEIEHHSILQGAFILRQVLPWYPPGTVHAVVVDPGVGTARRIIAAKYAGQYVVAPDNGLISLVHHHLPVEGVRVVENPNVMLGERSSTFHGRDIIGPAAAHLSGRVRFQDLGPPTDHVEVLELAVPRWASGDAIEGRVIHCDTFGNLITNIPRELLRSLQRQRPAAEVHLGDARIGPVRGTYGEVGPGEPLALIGSSGLLEIAVNTGSARERFNAPVQSIVMIR